MTAIKRRPRKSESGIYILPVDDISPSPVQPRKHFNHDGLNELAVSIRQHGILQPLSVRSRGGKYELVAGERRLRAAKIAGLNEVPCIILNVNMEESSLIALVENLQRRDLDVIEEAEGIARLMETCAFTQEQTAKSLGMAPSTLSNKLRLLKLAPETRAEIHRAGLTERHARALLRLGDPQRQQVLHTVIESQLNVQDTDQLIDALLTVPVEPSRPPAKKRPTIVLVRDVRLFVNTIHHAVDAMRRSGISALAETSESGEYLIYTVRIPRGDAVAVGSARAQQRERRKAG